METTTQATPAETMLKPFQDTGLDGRYGMDRQWIKDGWRMASDARIAARVLTGEPDYIFTRPDGTQPRVPRMDAIFEPWLKRFEQRDGFEPLTKQECDACKSTGRIKGECKECWGSGRTTCPRCEHEHDCDNCDGTGDSTDQCPKCADFAVSEKYVIDCKYWHAITALPSVAIAHVEEMSLFVFDCNGLTGQGIVMHKKTTDD